MSVHQNQYKEDTYHHLLIWHTAEERKLNLLMYIYYFLTLYKPRFDHIVLENAKETKKQIWEFFKDLLIDLWNVLFPNMNSSYTFHYINIMIDQQLETLTKRMLENQSYNHTTTLFSLIHLFHSRGFFFFNMFAFQYN